MNESPENQSVDRNAGSSAGHCVFDRIGELYSEYVDAWKTDRPNLVDYIARVSVDERVPLVRNLLEFEIPFRRGMGEVPTASDYLSRLPPELSEVVRLVFLEGSTWLGSRIESTQSEGENSVKSISPELSVGASRLGDYRLIRELGRGGMGTVYEAIHVTRGHRVALKTLPTVSADSLHRFKREFRTLSEVTHPNLVGLRTLESDGGQWFITLDLLEGTNFLDYVRPHGKLDLEQLRNAFAQLCSGVMALHARGVVHRDLKPSNVMVSRDGRVVILDFGLVVEFDRGGLGTDTINIAGTPAYMAPEQASGESVGPAADWYAVGTMLYEAMSGRRPFIGSVAQILKEKCIREADSLPNQELLPADLISLCVRLLARLPEQRPLQLEIADLVSLTTNPTLREQNFQDRLVGRDVQLGRLQAMYEDFRKAGNSAFAYVIGRSGEGKSSLVEAFLRSIQDDRRLVIISGRCYDRESVPFKALDSLIDALAGHLRSLPETEAALLLPDDIGMLVELFPTLRRCDVIARAPRPRLDVLDQQQVRQRAFAALRLLLERIGSQTPVVCFIDDLQWGDSDSAAALFEVLCPPHAPQVFLLVSYRSDEAENSPFLNEWGIRQHQGGVRLLSQTIEVGPLTLDEATQLLMQQMNRYDEAMRRRAMQFHAQTGGNPFLLLELAACYDPEADTLQTMDINGVLQRKLASLPPAADRLLEVVSVSGQSLLLSEAAEVAEVLDEVDELTTRTRNSRLLRVIRDKIDTYHDRIRYAVLDNLPVEKTRMIHLKLARCIERSVEELQCDVVSLLDGRSGFSDLKPSTRIYDLAYHFDAAGEHECALKYSAIAAVQARSQYALDVAAQQYSIAQRNSTNAPAALRFQLARGKAEALLLLGRYSECQEELNQSLQLAETAYEYADVRGLMGELASKQGCIGASIEHYEAGIERLGLPVPRSAFALTLTIFGQSVRQTLHSLAPSRIPKTVPTREEQLSSHLLGRIDWSYYCNNAVKLVWASLRGLNQAERAPASRALIVNYIVHANDMAVLGWHSRARHYYEAARNVSQQLNDHWGMAVASNHRGFGCLAEARYRQSLEFSRPGIEAFKRLGDLWELHLVYYNLSNAYFRLGDFQNAIHYARLLFDQCVRTGDNYISAAILCAVSRCSLGDIPFEELRSCIAVESGNHLGESMAQMAEGYWHSHNRRTAEALQAFEAGWKTAVENFCLMPPNANVLNDLVAALRIHSESCLQSDSVLSRQLQKRYRKLIPWMLRLSRVFPSERPQALREAAIHAVSLGKLKKARKLSELSCRIASQQEAAYEQCLSELVRAEVLQKLGTPDSAQLIAMAKEKIQAFREQIAKCIPH